MSHWFNVLHDSFLEPLRIIVFIKHHVVVLGVVMENKIVVISVAPDPHNDVIRLLVF